MGIIKKVIQIGSSVGVTLKDVNKGDYIEIEYKIIKKGEL